MLPTRLGDARTGVHRRAVRGAALAAAVFKLLWPGLVAGTEPT